MSLKQGTSVHPFTPSMNETGPKQHSARTSNPVKLSFENLEFEVSIRLNREDAKLKGVRSFRQMIVKGVSGYALPGQTTYIMGSSGAGKTSLLNILSDRISTKGGSTIKGKVLVNDQLPLT